MRRVEDFTHPTPHGGECRIRIFEEGGEVPVVICTEARENPGQSITNAAERIAAEVMTNNPEILTRSTSPPSRASLTTNRSSGSNTTRTGRGGPLRTGRRST